MSERILTTEQAAEALGVTATRIRAMIADKRLKADKFGRVHMIKESDLEAVRERKTGRPSKQNKQIS